MAKLFWNLVEGIANAIITFIVIAALIAAIAYSSELNKTAALPGIHLLLPSQTAVEPIYLQSTE